MGHESVKEVSVGKTEMASAKSPGSKTSGTICLECLKNHAATIGGHAVDGCCEFIADSGDSMKCGACGCHRNFHRPLTKGESLHLPLNFCAGCCGGQHPPPAADPPYPTGGSELAVKAASPPPLAGTASPCSASAPQMLLALSGSAPTSSAAAAAAAAAATGSLLKKRPRNRFTEEQRERMCAFAEKIGWTLRGECHSVIDRFCEEIGVERSALKVWVHNNKHALGKKVERDYNNTPLH